MFGDPGTGAYLDPMQDDKSTGDSMVQPRVDWDRFRNASNLVLVEPNRIMGLIYDCIRFAIC